MNQKEETYLKMVEENQNRIFKIASFYTDDNDSRKDLMQEIAYQLWRSIDSFNYQSDPGTWLYRVALNTSIKFLRDRKKDHEEQSNWIQENQGIESNENSDQSDSIQKLKLAINQLKQTDRALVLLYLENKSHLEISEIMVMSITNVGTRIQRIKSKLKEMLNENGR